MNTVNDDRTPAGKANNLAVNLADELAYIDFTEWVPEDVQLAQELMSKLYALVETTTTFEVR